MYPTPSVKRSFTMRGADNKKFSSLMCPAMSFEEIGRKLGVTEKSARSTCERAMKKLRASPKIKLWAETVKMQRKRIFIF